MFSSNSNLNTSGAFIILSKTTLSLNQNLLYDFITKSIGEDEEITKLINESKTLWEENETLIKQKNEVVCCEILIYMSIFAY